METLHTSCEPRVFSVAPFQACVGSEKGRSIKLCCSGTSVIKLQIHHARALSRLFLLLIQRQPCPLSSIISFPGKIELDIVRIGSVPSAGSSLAVHYDMLIACPYGYRVLLWLVLWLRISICSSQGNGKNIFGWYWIDRTCQRREISPMLLGCLFGSSGQELPSFGDWLRQGCRLHHRIHRQPLTISCLMATFDLCQGKQM